MPQLRLLTPDDAEKYAAIRREMLGDTPTAFTGSPENDRGCNAELVRASLAQGHEPPQYAIVGVIEAGRLIASAGLIRKEQPKRHHIATIWGVFVSPAARGRGLGRAVVTTAIETARGWPGVACVLLTVSERNTRARAMYESLGFAAWGVEPDAMRIGGVSLAEVYMRLPL